MPPQTLVGETLGEKHKHFNKLVQDAVENKQINLSKIDYDDCDIDNLLKIHTACETKNVDYIIEVLKCEDMLYVSTAIKHSTWLITEQQYAHIVNPEYLSTKLFPHMLTQAINKLLLHIRLHLRDEKRVEAFYDYIKDTIDYDAAQKWLLHCSVPFVENVIQNEPNLSYEVYKRLCKRTIIFLPYHTKVNGRNSWRRLDVVLLFMKANTEECLNFLDTIDGYNMPQFRKKYTEIILKKYPERILDNFEKYKDSVDLSVVSKYIEKGDIKNFILKQTKNSNMKYYFSNHRNLKHFIRNMPEQDRFEFVKKTYIDKIEEPSNPTGQILYSSTNNSVCFPPCSINTYEWYQYAPFNVALTELKKLIRAESSPAVRSAMLFVLISCASKNMQHAKAVLQYYYDKHRNEPFKFKLQFVNKVITKMATHEFDTETWSILDKLFHSLEVYIESNNDVMWCIQAIIVYKVLHNESVPDIIETKIVLDTFEKIHSRLDDKHKDQLFNYLITYMTNKITKKAIASESDFNDTLILLSNFLDLLKNWKRDIKKYAVITQNIKELIKIKKQNSWQMNLSSIYNIEKSWRRHLFEESLILCPSERVCMNALKHDPQLLQRYSEEVDALRKNDSVTLKPFLTRLRVYWFHTLARQWTDAYLNNIDKSSAHKALIKGLFVLLPPNQLKNMAKKYVPKDAQIDWNEINQTELSLSKNIAKNLYIARPLPSLEVILWYAKVDYLQYAVPSLNAILYNLSNVQSRVYIPTLLGAPVSVQKYGLHLAIKQLKYEELKSLFSDIWKNTKNLTIRTHIFIHIFSLLCKVKEATVAKNLWEVLNIFISNLTVNDSKDIFSKLDNAEKVHVSVRGEFFMKSYVFLLSLPPRANCENQKNKLIRYAPNIMHLLDNNFVPKVMLAGQKLSPFIHIISSYVLHGKTEKEQCERFRKVLIPALEHAFASWDLVKNETYTMKENVDEIFKALIWDLRKFLSIKKIIVPVKLFSEILTFIEQNMPIEENYVRCASWKLITEYTKLIGEHVDIFSDARLDKLVNTDISLYSLPDDAEKVWEELHIKLSPKLGPIIVKHLKADSEKYFPSICWLFSEALDKMFSNLSFDRNLMKIETLKYMIVDEDFIPSYIIACYGIPKYCNEEETKKLAEIRKILSTHPSREVQMHYKKAFGNTPLQSIKRR